MSTNENITWAEAMHRYNMAMVTLENIRSMVSGIIGANKVKRYMTVKERNENPTKKTITELSPEEILQHATRMEEDLNKIYGFIKQFTNP